MKPVIAEPAVSFLVVSLLTEMMGQVDDPDRLAITLVEQLRGLTGAQVVALVRSGGQVAACSPERRRAGIVEEMPRLAELAAAPGTTLCAEPAGGLTLVVPLRHHDQPMGFLAGLGLPSSSHMGGFTAAMDLLGSTAALALRSGDLLTERRQELAAKDQLLAHILQTAPVGVCLLQHGLIAIVNRHLEDISGHPAAELIGRPLRLFAADDGEFQAVMARLSAAGGQPGGREAQAAMITRGGGRREVQLCASPLDPADPAAGLVVIVQDVTERLRLERALHEGQAMESLGRLASGVAHDFNNQLSAITGYAELLLRQAGPDAGIAKKAGVILAAARRSAELTRQLLAFARRAAHRHEAIDLRPLVEELAVMIGHGLDRRIELVLDLAEDCRIDGDPGLFQNALLNLALNARDAMPEGGVLRLATARRRLTPEDCLRAGLAATTAEWVEVAVGDTGVGMPPEVQARIFEPFFTTKGPGKGTGLGLSAVHGTVHQMGGGIQVESRPGAGTTIRLLLPAGRLAVSDAGEAPPPPVRPVRLLVVDDEPDVRGALCGVLAAQGHQVAEAADGPAAIRWFLDHAAATDLVLLDLNMPRMNGVEVLKSLLAIDPAVPVLIVTGNAGTAMGAGVLALGARAILEKPLSSAALAGISAFARAPV